ncbi:MAG: patatin-like phospholipase family protein [Bacilli bacterium]|nr:patatin-like phospholipase family protein [Bacilli bacterium]MBN2696407.1 patatin-like phospholipase family protein [Bacilli bacterium]
MPKIGLCLAGGGARGAYQIGAAKALEEKGVFNQISAFSGTSIGAVNACMLATKGVDETYEIWKAIDHEVLQSTEGFFRRLLKERLEFVENGMYTIDELRKLLNKHLNYDELRKREVYVTISEGGSEDTGFYGLLKASFDHYFKKQRKSVHVRIEDQTEEFIRELILASCSIPIVFSPIRIAGKKYYDGGIYDNVPVEPLVSAGCDVIIVIHLHKLNFIDKSKYPDTHFIEIKHKHSLGGILNFDPDQTEKTYEYGYADIIMHFEQHPEDLPI